MHVSPLAGPLLMPELVPADDLLILWLEGILVGVLARGPIRPLGQRLLLDLGDTIHQEVPPATPLAVDLLAALDVLRIVTPDLPLALPAVLPPLLDDSFSLRHL